LRLQGPPLRGAHTEQHRLLSRLRVSNYFSLFKFTIGLEQAQAFRKAHGYAIKPGRWQDIDVEVYI
jgi:hypothetical protein